MNGDDVTEDVKEYNCLLIPFADVSVKWAKILIPAE